MKEAISKETVSDSSHSHIPEGNGHHSSGTSLKSAAMLGLALSVGASGALVSQAEASAAVSAPTPSATTEAFSSNSEASAPAAKAAANPQVVAYHTVESGESLWQIAQQHRVGLRELKDTNALPPETSIRVGQVLKVPSSTEPANKTTSELIAGIVADEVVDASTEKAAEPAIRLQAASEKVGSPAAISIEIADASTPAAVTTVARAVTTAASPATTPLATPAAFNQYRVRSGDTLGAIASSAGTTPKELMQANRLANPNVILAGDLIRVPSSNQSDNSPSASSLPVTGSSQRTENAAESAQVSAPKSAPKSAQSEQLIAELRSAVPEEPASVGGEQVTAKDLLGSTPARAESVDPYVANLLAEVREIRSQSVKVSEANTAESTITESDAAQVATQSSTVQSSNSRSSDRPLTETNASSPLLARTERPALRSVPSPSSNSAERVSLTTPAQPAAIEADADLLAAAPLSPDAYIPAQRSAAPQVVSPDMPILPAADEYLPEAPDYFDGYIWPARGTITSGYGWRWGRMHRGVDVAGPVGTPIVAAGSGVVAEAGWNSGGYGNMVEIRHPDGSMTRYAHNNRLVVSAGQSVKQGQQIAEMGSTGYSTGPHLHFEVHPNGGEAVNPIAFLPSNRP
ncbi:MAG: peptidoglycan DD-metalloendopeptidase family protein [Phormidesmis sp.]